MKKIYMLCLVFLTLMCGVANAGELFEYQATDREGLLSEKAQALLISARANSKKNKGVFPVTLNPMALRARTLTFTSPDGVKTDFVGQRSKEVSLITSFSWVGKSSRDGDTIRINGDVGALFGSVQVGDRKFIISTLDHGVYSVTESIRQIHSDDTPATTGTHPLPVKGGASTSSFSDQAVTTVAGIPTIRVLMIWTDAAVSVNGGSANTVSTSQFMIDETNDSFIANGINLRVEYSQITTLPAYPLYFSSLSTILANLKAADNVKVLRDNSTSDVVMMVSNSDDAYLNGLAAQVYATPQTAFFAMSWEGAIDKVFQHELGHLIGARHQASGVTLLQAHQTRMTPTTFRLHTGTAMRLTSTTQALLAVRASWLILPCMPSTTAAPIWEFAITCGVTQESASGVIRLELVRQRTTGQSLNWAGLLPTSELPS